jgi:multiple sugar transport system substrate-binding protein
MAAARRTVFGSLTWTSRRQRSDPRHTPTGRRPLIACAIAAAAFWTAGAGGHSPTAPPATQDGAGRAGAPADTRRLISVWTQAPINTAEFDALETSATRFNRTHRTYRVEISASVYKRYEDRVENAALTGTLPCLIAVDHPFVSPFAWRGYLQPLDRFITSDLRNDLLPAHLAEGRYDGRLYTLAQFDSGLGLWANRRFLQQASVVAPTVTSPWTLATFERALEKLTALDTVDYALNLSVHATTGEFYAYAYPPILQGFGGDVINRSTGKAGGTLDGPHSVAAMKRLQFWFQRGWARPVFDRVDDFEQKKAALAWTGHWKYPAFREALGPNLLLLPLPDFGRGIKTGIGSWGWGISSTCSEPAGAWAFLAFLLAPDEILRMTKSNGAIPARASVLARSPLYGRHGPLRVFADQLRAGFGVPRPATPGYAVVRAALSQAITAIIAGADVKTELTKAARTIDEDVARHGG